MVIYSEFTHLKKWFSIVTLVYQRVIMFPIQLPRPDHLLILRSSKARFGHLSARFAETTGRVGFTIENGSLKH